MQMYDLVEDITKQLEEAGMKQLFEEIEVPLTRVLYAMEKEGVVTSLSTLDEIAKETNRKIEDLAETNL